MVEPKLRLMNFVPESQEEELPEPKGKGAEYHGTSYDSRPLFEILKDNKDKKDAEFNERFKHRPPKALDDDETEFLENVEMIKREQERQRAEEETQQLINFQAEIASRTIPSEGPTTISHQDQERKENPLKNKRPPKSHIMPVAVKIKPIPKKQKSEAILHGAKTSDKTEQKDVVAPSSLVQDSKAAGSQGHITADVSPGGLLGLVSYSDESDDDD